MPLGILTDKEFEDELNSLNGNKPIKETEVARIEKMPTSGRNEGDTNKPETLRQVIAECKINGADDKAIMEAFKTSTSSIHAYSNGKNSTASDHANDKLAKFVKNARNSITRKASRRLISALDQITDDKISELKANEISVLAKNMSSIINDMQEKNTNIDNSMNAQFVIFAPPQKPIDRYDVIEVNS